MVQTSAGQPATDSRPFVRHVGGGRSLNFQPNMPIIEAGNTISTTQQRTLVQNGMIIASIADSFNSSRNDEMSSMRDKDPGKKLKLSRKLQVHNEESDFYSNPKKGNLVAETEALHISEDEKDFQPQESQQLVLDTITDRKLQLEHKESSEGHRADADGNDEEDFF